MKSVFGILFIIVLLGNTLSLPLYYFYYNMNTAYITELFCINKENKALNCHGQCHLNKVTAQLIEQDKDAKVPLPTIEKRTPINLFLEVGQFSLTPESTSFKTVLYYYPQHYHHLFIPSIFHPPESIV